MELFTSLKPQWLKELWGRFYRGTPIKVTSLFFSTAIKLTSCLGYYSWSLTLIPIINATSASKFEAWLPKEILSSHKMIMGYCSLDTSYTFDYSGQENKTKKLIDSILRLPSFFAQYANRRPTESYQVVDPSRSSSVDLNLYNESCCLRKMLASCLRSLFCSD